MAATITPHNISVPQESIDQLHQRLKLTRLPNELDTNEPWARGAPLKDVRRLVKYWMNDFDWRASEAQLNELPNYLTKVSVEGFGEIDIHFVHQKAESEQAIPLLFCHGWPGSFIEVKKLLPLLKGNKDLPAFHVVAPSLPNYAFSGSVEKPGFALAQYAETCQKLMLQLGYAQYVTQGGDWGFYITRCIGKLYPDSCLASHINMVRSNPPSFMQNPLIALKHALTPYTSAEKRGLERTRWFDQESSGYRLEQSTKPQTLGYALGDSPVGLLAWIYEKLHDWTDEYPWTDNEICTWVSIYWFSTAGPASNLRIYYEAVHTKDARTKREAMATWTPKVKLGLAYFPKELAVNPRSWGRTLGPVVRETVFDRGGHFAAWERPEVIAEELQRMFSRNGPCHGIVQGRTGYDGQARANL